MGEKAGALAVQDRYSPSNQCFGCGPANERGLQIKSFPAEDGEEGELVCEWMPEEHHRAFGKVLYGGLIGALFDCHGNWTAACFLMDRDGSDRVPPTVTLEFHVKFKRPTATDHPVRLRAWPSEKNRVSEKGRVVVEATLSSQGKVTATCTATFVVVPPGHPAHDRF